MKPSLIVASLALLVCGTAAAAPLDLPFDYSRGAIGLDATINGAPVYLILDTGVDPSVISLGRATALGLAVDRAAGGEASGEGDSSESKVFPSRITGLSLGGTSFAPFEALAFDTAGLSAGYGRQLDGVLGYSFLNKRIVLIDYPARRLRILDRVAEARPTIKSCRTHWSIPLTGFPGDNIPKIPGFRFGSDTGSISLDTGSNGGISLYQAALARPGIRAALTEQGQSTFTGARGVGSAKRYILNRPVGFGPFTLPAGQIVTVRESEGSDPRLANIGNKLFEAMGLKILFDYRARRIAFHGDCH